MFGKKQPVLTGRYCDRMEKLRLAIEVLQGQRTTYIHIDFNTGKAKVLVGRSEFKIVFDFAPDDLIHFVVDEEWAKNNWYIARFDFEPGEVRVISEQSPVKRGEDHSMWWAGRSATERRLEPLDKNGVEYCAKVRGLTVEEYLNS